jgi:hypothetical protein
MSDLDKRYPLSTADGQAIPLEIIKPHGIIKKSFLSSAATAAMAVPSTIDIIAISADQDVIVQFASSSASAAALVDGVLTEDAVYIQKDIITVVSPPIDKKSFSIIGDTANGTAIFQFIERWGGISLASQITRR